MTEHYDELVTRVAESAVESTEENTELAEVHWEIVPKSSIKDRKERLKRGKSLKYKAENAEKIQAWKEFLFEILNGRKIDEPETEFTLNWEQKMDKALDNGFEVCELFRFWYVDKEDKRFSYGPSKRTRALDLFFGKSVYEYEYVKGIKTKIEGTRKSVPLINDPKFPPMRYQLQKIFNAAGFLFWFKQKKISGKPGTILYIKDNDYVDNSKDAVSAEVHHDDSDHDDDDDNSGFDATRRTEDDPPPGGK